jgi:hypothetical protein
VSVIQTTPVVLGRISRRATGIPVIAGSIAVANGVTVTKSFILVKSVAVDGADIFVCLSR